MKTIINDHILPYVTICFALQLGACSSTKNLDKEQSPLMTVRIDGADLSNQALYNLTAAVNSTNRFYAVDRHVAFTKAEDEFKLQSTNKVPPQKRYLRVSEIQGAGSVLLGTQSCGKMMMWFSREPFYRCTQSITLVDASTSMIIHSVSNTTDGDLGFAEPTWTDTVNLFAGTMPASFNHEKQRSLRQFEDTIKP